jgi:hypothetical protein
MFSEKHQQIIVTNAPVPARRAIGGQQILFDPVDNGSRVDVQQTTDLMCRVDRLAAGLRLFHHAQLKPTIYLRRKSFPPVNFVQAKRCLSQFIKK